MSILSSGLRVATAAVVVAFSFAGPNTAGIARADGPDGSAVASDSAHVGPAVRSRSARAPQRVASSPPVAAQRAAAAASRNQTPQRMPASSIGHSRGDALPASSVAVRSAASTSVDSTQGVGGSTATAVNSAASAATAIADKVAAAHIGTVGSSARKALQDRASCPSCWAFDGGQLHAALPPKIVVAINQLFDNAANWLSGLPPSPVRDLVAGALVLVRRTFFNFDGGNVGSGVGSAGTITFTELDSLTSPLAVRVDKTQQKADAIKVDAGTTFTLTLPGAASGYTVVANKPNLVDITTAGSQIQVTAKTPGFLGLAITSKDGNAERYVGLYIADPATHVVPDTVTGYVPVGSVTTPGASGANFLESFNYRSGVAPIDYLYIYDQGGADYTDGNLKGLLTQAAQHGEVPVVVFYNIQNVLDAAGKPTNVVEGPDAAFQAINNFSRSDAVPAQDPSLFDGYMDRYYAKVKTDFTTMNDLGIPVQIVMEPDFLGYMASALPSFQSDAFVPVKGDRTQNTALVSAMYDQGLLTQGVDPSFPNTVAGMVQAMNYYVGTDMPNLRIGWKTNLWAVADQQNWSLGLLHMTDTSTYPWQGEWTGPAKTWAEGRAFIAGQAAGLASFLDKVGVRYWQGSADRTPFLAIDKYGVDGAYTFDPAVFDPGTQTAAFGNLGSFVLGANNNIAKLTEADSQKYFALSKADFQAFCAKYAGTGFNPAAADVQAVFTTLQNAAKADPNLAQWFFNADQWNNYLYFVENLSDKLGGTKVMLWQIPQGHINGSTTLSGRDLSNTNANFEDSATSYFFGDSFTATGGRLDHFKTNRAGDPLVSDSGNTITWGEHMTLAGQSGVMSVLFGAGLGVSTRGTPTPGGLINDHNFWFDKATGYLSGVSQ